MHLFIEQLFTDPVVYILIVVLMAFSICVHEFSHSLAARLEGDDTGERLGFMTMNPLIVMGTHSLIALLIFGFAWGRVPINPSRMRHRWSGAWVAFAGPLSNFLLAIVFTALLLFGSRYEITMIGNIGMCGLYANVLLGVFNLLPIPMLDGWHVFEYFIPAMRRVSMEHRNMILFIAILLLWVTRLSVVLDYVVRFVMALYLRIFSFLF